MYRSPNIVKVIKSIRLRWAGHVARMDECFQNFNRKTYRKETFGNGRTIYNIRMDLEEIGINAVNWVDSAEDRNYWRALVNAALNLRVP